MLKVIGSILCISGIIILLMLLATSNMHTKFWITSRFNSLTPMRIIKFNKKTIGIYDAGSISVRKIEGLRYNVSVRVTTYPLLVRYNNTLFRIAISIDNATVYTVRKTDYPVIRGYIASMGDTVDDVKKLLELLDSRCIGKVTLQNMFSSPYAIQGVFDIGDETLDSEISLDFILLIFPKRDLVKVISPKPPPVSSIIFLKNISIARLKGNINVRLEASLNVSRNQVTRAIDITMLGVLMLGVDIYRNYDEYKHTIEKLKTVLREMIKRS
ncbi:MAG: hypothetical protein DRO01_06880 [Thermoproteota archaeon]|nr:MAG: hypothetical protein DRO01_06880 [Candidatus Korarchaeota archaeon]